MRLVPRLLAASLLALPCAAAAQPAPAAPAPASAPLSADAKARQTLARQLKEQAQVAAQRGQRDRALELYRQALAAWPAYPLVHNELGFLEARAGRLDAAADHLQEAVSLDPELAEAWANLGEVLRRQGQHEPAAAALTRFLTFKPDDAPAYYALAHVFQARKHNAAALWAMERFLERHGDPNGPQALEVRQAAARLIRDGVVAQDPGVTPALADSERPTEAPPRAAQADAPAEPLPEAGDLPAHPGDDAFAQARYVEALTAYEAALAGSPDDVVLLYKLGAVHAVMNDPRAAARRWRQALALDPDRALVRRHLALLELKLEEAQLTELTPEIATPTPDALVAARQALVGGRPELAAAVLAGATDDEARYLEGEAALRLGDPKAAQAAFEARLAKDPSDHVALGGLAEALVRQDAGTRASDTLRKWQGQRRLAPEEFVVLRSVEAGARIAFGPPPADEPAPDAE